MTEEPVDQPPPSDPATERSQAIELRAMHVTLWDKACGFLRWLTEGTRSAAKAGIGLLYIFYWGSVAKVRYWVQRAAILVLAGAVVLLPFEIYIEVKGVELATHAFGWVRIAFWIALIALLVSKLYEWRERKQQFYFPKAAMVVAQLLAKDRSVVASDHTLQSLLAVFAETFAHKGGPNANIALLTGKNTLKICHHYPAAADYSEALELPVGEGGAGFCVARNCLVYFPRIGFRHGIFQTMAEDQPYRVQTDLYVAPRAKPKYRSVLSVPLTVYGECFGVLNFDSIKADPFSRVDFEQAMFYGVAVAQVLHIRREQETAAATAASQNHTREGA